MLSDFNKSIDSASFPVNLKNADITPAHKKGDRTDKSNYRPVGILPAMSKIYEKLLYCQISTHIETKLAENLWFQERTQCSTLPYSNAGEMESNS